MDKDTLLSSATQTYPVGAWIRCDTGRLPADNQPVLFLAGEFNYPLAMFFGFRTGNEWYLNRDFYAAEWPFMHAPSNIIAWLPIPEWNGERVCKAFQTIEAKEKCKNG